MDRQIKHKKHFTKPKLLNYIKSPMPTSNKTGVWLIINTKNSSNIHLHRSPEKMFKNSAHKSKVSSMDYIALKQCSAEQSEGIRRMNQVKEKITYQPGNKHTAVGIPEFEYLTHMIS